MAAPDHVLVVDLGNTRLKGAVYGAAGPELRFDLPLTAVLDGTVSWPASPGLAPVVCSVLEGEPGDSVLARLGDWSGCPARLVGRDLPVPLAHDYRTPETLGADRLVAAWAAFGSLGRDVVVADAGSALTVDWVDATGTFRGGAIAPGLRAVVASLKAAAPRLDWGALDTTLSWPGRDSDACCRVGVTAAARGMVRELFGRALATAGPGVPLVLTGGDAERVAELWAPEPLLLRPDLLLEGLARLAGRPPRADAAP